MGMEEREEREEREGWGVGVAHLVEESSEKFLQVGVVRLVLKPK